MAVARAAAVAQVVSVVLEVEVLVAAAAVEVGNHLKVYKNPGLLAGIFDGCSCISF